MSAVTAMRARAAIGQNMRGQSSFVAEVLRMIKCGVGIGFLPMHLARPALSAERIWQLLPSVDLPDAPVHLVWNPAIDASRAEALFPDRTGSGMRRRRDRDRRVGQRPEQLTGTHAPS